MHDKVIIADGRNIEVGSFNYTCPLIGQFRERVSRVGCSSRCSTLSAALVTRWSQERTGGLINAPQP
jgi:hypothetical protein